MVPDLVGVPKEPKPWEATLPPPVVKVPLGFCSVLKVADWPKLKALAPLFPNRLLAPDKPQQQKNTKNGRIHHFCFLQTV